MIEELLEIDITKTHEETNEEDLIDIEINQEKSFKLTFSKLFIQSRYVRDKYKYSEAISVISSELSKLQKTSQIKDSSIENFLKYIEEGKVRFHYEEYHDMCKLAKYFEIVRLTYELDEIFRLKLCDDLNFSIETLIYSEREKEEIENDFLVKIENFLSERINESLSNKSFGRLPISIIYRIVEKSDNESLNINVLNDFIFESIESRFVLLKFLELDKISNENVDKFIQFFENQEATTKEKYLEYMPFNLSFIKEMKKKYDELTNLFRKTNEKFQQTKVELQQTKKELQQKNKKIQQIGEEFQQKNRKMQQTKEDFQQTKKELQQKSKKIQTKEEFQQTKEDLKEKERIIQKSENESTRIKSENESTRIKSEDKQYAKSIVAAGYDAHNHLGVNPNNRSKNSNYGVLHPPQNLPIEPSSLLSYSSYFDHTILITRSGSIQGIGFNRDGRMSSSLPNTDIEQFSEFSMNAKDGQRLVPVSAVCGVYYTLFMFSKKSGSVNQLVFCDKDINGGSPVFLDIGNKQPLSLFGGHSHSAAISTEGEVIFINRNSVKNSPSARIESSSLPNGEKATSVACGMNRIIALSSCGGVFSSEVDSTSSVLKFSKVEELSGKEIVWVSGTCGHFLAVSKEGRVFGCGSNNDGKLGLGEGRNSVTQFIEISSLFGYEIRSAYAGSSHSLFETREGKILSCGFNYYGQLLLSSGPGDSVYSPRETMITSGATFCIAGSDHSSVFIEVDPPPNTPNMPIKF